MGAICDAASVGIATAVSFVVDRDTVSVVYLPSAFAEPDRTVIAEIVRAHPLAQLVVHGDDGLVATPVPMTIRVSPQTGEWTFVGHLAKANPVLVAGASLAIFSGVSAYISPSLYPTKAEHGRVVPTWNYETVQVKGELVLHREPEWILALVAELTAIHEGGRTTPWSVNDAPAEYIDGLLRAIVGFELLPTTVTAKRKLSQNQPENNRIAVKTGLDGGTVAERAVAAAMAP